MVRIIVRRVRIIVRMVRIIVRRVGIIVRNVRIIMGRTELMLRILPPLNQDKNGREVCTFFFTKSHSVPLANYLFTLLTFAGDEINLWSNYAF